MGKNGLSSMVLFAMVIASVMMVELRTEAQTVHVVGDTLGWTIPANDDVYDNWSDNKIFRVGDILTFNFATGSHDVAEVTEAVHDSCTPTTTIGSVITTGPANVTLTSVGDHYYICTVGSHCAQGQKLDITVTAASSPPPPPPAATPPPSASPPPPMTPPPSASPPPTMSPSPMTPPPSAAPQPMTPPPTADAPTSPSPSMNGPASPTTPAPSTPASPTTPAPSTPASPTTPAPSTPAAPTPDDSSSSVVLAGVMGTVLSVAAALFI